MWGMKKEIKTERNKQRNKERQDIRKNPNSSAFLGRGKFLSHYLKPIVREFCLQMVVTPPEAHRFCEPRAI